MEDDLSSPSAAKVRLRILATAVSLKDLVDPLRFEDGFGEDRN